MMQSHLRLLATGVLIASAGSAIAADRSGTNTSRANPLKQGSRDRQEQRESKVNSTKQVDQSRLRDNEREVLRKLEQELTNDQLLEQLQERNRLQEIEGDDRYIQR